jgi:hypothetical protein
MERVLQRGPQKEFAPMAAVTAGSIKPRANWVFGFKYLMGRRFRRNARFRGSVAPPDRSAGGQ